jgi:hypothetical protein
MCYAFGAGCSQVAKKQLKSALSKKTIKEF